MSFFDDVKTFPDDPIFGLVADFRADPRKDKVDLVVGVYRTADLKAYLMTTVKEAESILWENEADKGYIPIKGIPEFVNEAMKITFGKEIFEKERERIAGVQTVGATGALRTGGDFIKLEVGNQIALATPTWANHPTIFKACGLNIENYPYYNDETHQLEFEKVLDHINKLKPRDVVLMQVSSHNPTGLDFKKEQWKELSQLIMQKQVLPFFDFAYQGFAMGIKEDAWLIRYFFNEGHEFLTTNTFAKSFGIYGERAGSLFVVSKDPKNAKKIGSRLANIIRGNYSVPPKHGAALVAMILGNPALKAKWEAEINMMRGRIQAMRTLFADKLLAKAKKRDFQYLKDRNGFFCMCGITPDQAVTLIKDHGIYTTRSGRINVTGLNENNVDRVVDSLLSVSEGA